MFEGIKGEIFIEDKKTGERTKVGEMPELDLKDFLFNEKSSKTEYVKMEFTEEDDKIGVQINGCITRKNLEYALDTLIRILRENGMSKGMVSFLTAKALVEYDENKEE